MNVPTTAENRILDTLENGLNEACKYALEMRERLDVLTDRLLGGEPGTPGPGTIKDGANYSKISALTYSVDSLNETLSEIGTSLSRLERL